MVIGEQLVLLATAITHILDGHGAPIRCRIICDPGSQVSFMSNRFFNQLAIRKKSCAIQVEGVGSVTTYTRGRALLNMASCDDTFGIDVNFYLLDMITTPTPACNIAPSCWQHLRALNLADPSFGKTGRIDALIGADVWGAIIQEGIVHGSPTEPYAQATRLGGVVFGPAIVDTTVENSLRSLHTSTHGIIGDGDARLELALARIFEFDVEPNATAKVDDDHGNTSA